MKKEKNVLVLTMFFNLLVALVKLVGGIVFDFSSLIADSLQSLTDFITDIISSIANNIGKKRANKKYPFGYGMSSNIANLFIGIVLVFLGVFILIGGFKEKEVVLSSVIFVILIIAICLKIGVICILYFSGKKLKSNVLLSSVRESCTDLISSFIVLVVSTCLLFENKYPIFGYADMVGSIIISIVVFGIAFSIIKENIQYLLGINEDNEEIIEKIEDIISGYKDIKDSSCKLMRMGSYYNLYLIIELDDNISLRRVFSLENDIKRKIKWANIGVKFIEIELKEFE